MSKTNHLPELGFAREPAVLAHVGFGRTKLRALVAAGEFPAPRRLGPRCTMYDAAAVRAWIADRAANAPIVMPKTPKAAQAATEQVTA
ncbi:MAG: AlpA family phage regulatory protein [Piscinibacter sp.]|uniref:helix-turn-helix transcriptional regulator n=1 Tax=Piscinibacter sp. TaxID=1903157 RepID=UPI0025869255|nr:AlpA family phage regulatory protein [Piscinibacter sp.]MCW5664025.1 AlpA family phage regulatory protein [Piscinibacter sp.]